VQFCAHGSAVVVVVGANVVPPGAQYQATDSPNPPTMFGSVHPHTSPAHPVSMTSVHGTLSSPPVLHPSTP
jgi:hypothetical protein